jgi:molybdate transport system substrate-binding protein
MNVAAFLILALLCAAPAGAAEIRVIVTQGIEQAYREIVPSFEMETGHKVTTLFTGIIDARQKIQAGEAFDLLIMPQAAIEPYFADGTVSPGTRMDLAQSGTGLGVKQGAPKPDISSTEAFKRTLLAARSVGTSSGPTGAYFLALIERLGITEEIKSKIKQTPSGVFVGSIIASGEVEIGFQQIGELSHYEGVDFVGPLPQEVQNITVFSSGIARNASEPGIARLLARHLVSPAAAMVYARRGMQPK